MLMRKGWDEQVTFICFVRFSGQKSSHYSVVNGDQLSYVRSLTVIQYLDVRPLTVEYSYFVWHSIDEQRLPVRLLVAEHGILFTAQY